MIVAVIAVRVMKVAIDKVIDVVTVRHRFVTAARPVHVARFVATAVVVRRATIRIFRADFDLVFVYMITMRVVQMAIMKVVDVVAMLNCGVSAARAMLMVMVSVMRFVARAHACLIWTPPVCQVIFAWSA
ncbi:hypothetical protein [Paraburkholderia youngii]|uniref:hypothetical protein n=1 Tax=Paraburkholderia youngii TaxID=2782701 RepID=UPI003D23E422